MSATNPSYEWEENGTSHLLFFDTVYVGRIAPQGASWKVEFQSSPDELPPHPHELIAIRPDVLSAKSCLAGYYFERRSQCAR